MSMQVITAVAAITAVLILIIGMLFTFGYASYRRDAAWVGLNLKTLTFTGVRREKRKSNPFGLWLYTRLAFFAPMKGSFVSTYTISPQVTLRDKMLMVQRQRDWAEAWFSTTAAEAVRYRMMFMERNLKYSKVTVVKRRHLTMARRKQMFTHLKKLHYSTVLYMPYYSRREQELIKFFIAAETPVEFAERYAKDYYMYEFVKGHPFTTRHLHPTVEEMKQLQQLPFDMAKQMMR